MVSRCRTCSRKSNGRRRRLDCVMRASYGGMLGELRGLGVPCFSLRACKW